MSVHEQFADDLALYSLESLEGAERQALEKHLEECASCRRELELLRGDLSLLALATAGPKPPKRPESRSDLCCRFPYRNRSIGCLFDERGDRRRLRDVDGMAALHFDHG